MPMIRSNGANLYYEDTGTGHEAIVFMHGLAWGTRLFKAQIEALRDEYRCIAFESRGHGRSDITRAGYELDNLAVDAVGVIESLHAGPCHLVGHSLGGSVAVRVASRFPALVRSLVLFHAAADEDPLSDRILFRLMSYGLEAFGMGAAVGKLMKTNFGEAFLHDPSSGEERDEIRRYFHSQDKHGIARAVRGWIRSPSVVSELPRIQAPTLVIAGQEDTTVKPKRSREIADKVRNGRFLLWPHCRQAAPVEAPGVATGALQEFVGSLAPQTA